MKLHHKNALVTGGSQGIGKAVALHLAKTGADIALNVLRESVRADQVLAQIESMGRRCVVLPCDVSDICAMRTSLEHAVGRLGTLDILVNNAGIERRADFLDVTEVDYDRVLDINLKAAFFLAQAFAAQCKAAGRGGKIINISSIHQDLPFPHFAPYCVSKGGMKMMMRNLAIEFAARHGAAEETVFLPQLRQEHAYWMNGWEGLASGAGCGRVVRLPSGVLLNRYWDDRDTPREESWLEDVTTVQACQRNAAEVYRNLRAACESGWDFSTRWLREPPRHAAPAPVHVRAATAPSLSSICTTDILPVDLNAFLYKLECKIAALSRLTGDLSASQEYGERADRRKAAVIELCWDDEQGAFFDYDWRLGMRRSCLTAACVTPLFVSLAERVHAQALATTVSTRLLAPGGMSTTECSSDQQWDRPNGWAPLQWMAIRGFAGHGYDALSSTIARRWLATVAAIYEREGKLVEKYALRRVEQEDTAGGAGGEYPLQDGFGWTNGVTCALLAEQPQHTANSCIAHDPLRRHR